MQTRGDRYGTGTTYGRNTDVPTRTVANVPQQVNILGQAINKTLYKYPQTSAINTRRGVNSGSVMGFYWSDLVPSLTAENSAYIKIYESKNTDEKVQAINARIIQILQHVNALGGELVSIGIRAENKAFWQTAAPFLVSVFFGGVGASLGGAAGFSVGFKLGNMVTGYSAKKKAVNDATVVLNIKKDIANLDTEAKALTAEISRIDANYLTKDKFYSDLISGLESRSAKLQNNIFGFGAAATILYLINRKK